MRYVIAILFTFLCTNVFTQASPKINIDTVLDNDKSLEKSLQFLSNKYSNLDKAIAKQNEKILKRMQEKEAKLKLKLQALDSLKAKELFDGIESKYKALQKKAPASADKLTKLKEYIPGLDSTTSALKFLSQAKSISNISPDKFNQLTSSINVANQLENKLAQANQIQTFIRAREAQLKSVLANTNLDKSLLGINKEVFYYQERLREYKAILNDRKKLEAKLIATVQNLPVFQEFISKYGFLAQLFPMNTDFGTPAGLIGLQSRASFQTVINQRLPGVSTGTISSDQYFQGQVQQVQAQLSLLKDKLKKYGYVSNDMTMPDFKPNEQRTKKFLQRIEYGFNIQSHRNNTLLPSTSDIAVHAGYKVNDRSSFGVGISYKLGWGTGWNNIRFSHQGIGLRSYVDIKAKGSIWISAGYEYNYLSEFKKLSDIKNIDVWQRSGLIGITKKYAIGKKKEGKIQVLYDLLATKQITQASPIKFRIGYNF